MPEPPPRSAPIDLGLSTRMDSATSQPGDLVGLRGGCPSLCREQVGANIPERRRDLGHRRRGSPAQSAATCTDRAGARGPSTAAARSAIRSRTSGGVAEPGDVVTEHQLHGERTGTGRPIGGIEQDDPSVGQPVDRRQRPCAARRHEQAVQGRSRGADGVKCGHRCARGIACPGERASMGEAAEQDPHLSGGVELTTVDGQPSGEPPRRRNHPALEEMHDAERLQADSDVVVGSAERGPLPQRAG